MKKLILTEIPMWKMENEKHISVLISKERLERAELFSDEYKKNRFLSAEITASKLVSQTFDIPYSLFNGKVGEKPYIRNYPKISISRSYSNQHLVLGMDIDNLIGVDCEKIQEIDKQILKYFFTDKESKYIMDCGNSDLAFSLLWTRKESYIKCIGAGLKYPLKSFDVTPSEEICFRNSLHPLFSHNSKVGQLFINSYLYKEFVISICSAQNDVFPDLQIKPIEAGL
ncbi:4'-phosphopantetheinyl transferase superfamily protein [Clostridiaceae bacterium M8S5]|nr:4'-phosphopantetheinyl transferase superfamily protein [Clostridiaceae bacterium M8S5]